MTLVFQGTATLFNTIIDDGEDLIYLKSGCFDESLRTDGVSLLIDHDKGQELTRRNDLELCATKSELVFRWVIPDESNSRIIDELSECADDFDSYLPISIGFLSKKCQKMTLDGVVVNVISEASIFEISVLSGAPAVKSSFGRLVSQDTCGNLEDDADRFKMHGAYISLHRTVKASENNGLVKYRHSPTPYDKAAAKFEMTLKKLDSQTRV